VAARKRRQVPSCGGSRQEWLRRASVAIEVAAAIVRANLPGKSRILRFGWVLSEALMFITPAFAQGTSIGGDGGMLFQLLPFVLIFVIMYFLILRPQQKRVKAHAEMVKNVRRGDTVVTSGGLVGKVTKVVDDDQIEVEISDNVRVRQMRSMVADVRAKGEPVKDEGASG